MLDLSDELRLMDALWEEMDAKVCLSAAKETQFLEAKGPTPNSDYNFRIGRRFFVRGKAVLIRGPLLLGVYTKDISRRGIAFLSPLQLLPTEQVLLLMPNRERLRLEIVHCRHVDEEYFECGSRFVL
jgi:hypothetical protein